jgi:hypothetical protein
VCGGGKNNKKTTDPEKGANSKTLFNQQLKFVTFVASDSSFWQNVEKHAHRNNYKIRKEISDWTASCSDHPVWIVNK